MKNFDRESHRKVVEFCDVNLERNFVAGIMRSKVYVSTMYQHVNSDHFSSDKLKWIYDQLVFYWLTEGILIDSEAFENIVDVHGLDTESYMALWRILNRKKLSVSMAFLKTASKKIKNLYQRRCIVLLTNSLVNSIKKSKSENTDIVRTSLRQITQCADYLNAVTASVSVADPISDYTRYKKDFQAIQKNPEKLRVGVVTGIEEIDKDLVLLRPGEYGMVAGPTGSGKSILLLNILTNCWLNQGGAVGVSIEMPATQYLQRLYCYVSGISYSRFRNYELDTDEWNALDKVQEKLKKIKNKLKILDFHEGCTVDSVKSEIQKLDFDPILVTLDYLNIMASSSGSFSLDWTNQVTLALETKMKIARGLRKATWSACQTNDDEKLAFARHIKDQLDVGLMLRPDEASKDTGIIPVDWIKTRDFRGSSFTLNTNYDVMRFGDVPIEIGKRRIELKREDRIKV